MQTIFCKTRGHPREGQRSLQKRLADIFALVVVIIGALFALAKQICLKGLAFVGKMSGQYTPIALVLAFTVAFFDQHDKGIAFLKIADKVYF